MHGKRRVVLCCDAANLRFTFLIRPFLKCKTPQKKCKTCILLFLMLQNGAKCFYIVLFGDCSLPSRHFWLTLPTKKPPPKKESGISFAICSKVWRLREQKGISQKRPQRAKKTGGRCCPFLELFADARREAQSVSQALAVFRAQRYGKYSYLQQRNAQKQRKTLYNGQNV